MASNREEANLAPVAATVKAKSKKAAVEVEEKEDMMLDDPVVSDF
jgi:hypothetical protein